MSSLTIMKKIVSLILLVIATTPLYVIADSDLYKPCAVCHGDQAEGNMALFAPRLAQQNAAYLSEQLLNFRSGSRGAHVDDAYGQIMAVSAKSLSDKDIERLSGFLANLPRKQNRPIKPINGDIQLGKRIYDENCLSCHGADGRGVTPLYSPNLRILSGAYIRYQLEAYRNGWRGNSEIGTTRSKGMRAIVTQINSEDEILDLLAFLTSL